jgi:hypothetical protein
MSSQTSTGRWKKLLDLLLLLGTAFVLVVLVGGAFVWTAVRDTTPVWVFLSAISIGFVAFAWEEYRKEFWSPRFALFVFGWVLVNIVIVVVILGSYRWFYLIPVLFLEQVLFYMTAYWIFGLQPRSRRRRKGPESQV